MRRKKLLLLLLIYLLFPGQLAYSSSLDDTTIYIDLWNSKLYLTKGEVIKEYPISHGTLNTPTPIGKFTVTEKAKEWGGGFGTRWLGLDVSWGIYGIHGTNKPWLIGKDVSSGCIRMLNKDVEQLYDLVSVGTTVTIEGPIYGLDQDEIKQLSLGSRGNLVQLVQVRLKAGGFYNGEIDGIYGTSTARAVKRLQRSYKIPVTGGITDTEYRILGLIE